MQNKKKLALVAGAYQQKEIIDHWIRLALKMKKNEDKVRGWGKNSCEYHVKKKLSLLSVSIKKKVNRVSKIKLKLHMASRRWTWVQQLVRFRRLELYIRLSHDEFSVSQMKIRGNVQARVVQTLDSAIHRINHYLADKCYGNRTNCVIH